MAVDPVCNMSVESESAAAQSEYKGTIYYFCSEGCLKEFEDHPDKYIAADGGDEAGSGHKH